MMENTQPIFGIINIQNNDGEILTSCDLLSKRKVIEVFDLCQILQAVIYPHGWKFLFSNYGLKGIIEIDKSSQWLNDKDIGEWISNIFYQSLISGYNPLTKELGKYNEDTGFFVSNNGHKTEIEWTHIYNLKTSYEL